MNPGTLREPISIYDRHDAVKANGYTEQTDTLVCSCRASRLDASTREVWEAYAAKAKNVVNWTIRAREAVRVGHWVVWKGQWHEIIAVQRPDGLPRMMILKTMLKNAK